MNIAPEALTRMVLGHDGSTTRLLSALLGEPLRVRIGRQEVLEAGLALTAELRAHLRVSGAERVIVRYSELVKPSGHAVSVNRVVMMPDRHPVIDHIYQGGDVPIGRLLDQHVPGHHRRLLRAGTRWFNGWAADSRTSASRAYIIMLGETPLLYVEEIFSPRVVPPVTDFEVRPSREPILPLHLIPQWREPVT
ncbi:chorismate pyruvate-lyase family protein [Acrocarpospora catenulata]|uniref:chorismate pyruvate-lyase family protein n=1 Tax=Acrocarpospora catenulata TaxID=2836182 RepID=UPI001BDB51E7|nr:chorismate pyruvate-lyase family protein [Acrocarpospora catenulata]